jgi:hypothetical protein
VTWYWKDPWGSKIEVISSHNEENKEASSEVLKNASNLEFEP